MRKALLVIDMPKSCDECDFIDERYHYCNVPWFGKDVSDYVACRHEDCPLKAMPQKQIPHCTDTAHHRFAKNGWNACIDEIAESMKGDKNEH